MKPAAAAPAAPTPAAAAPTPGNASCDVFAVLWKTHVKLLKMFFRLFYFIIKMNYALGFHSKRQIVSVSVWKPFWKPFYNLIKLNQTLSDWYLIIIYELNLHLFPLAAAAAEPMESEDASAASSKPEEMSETKSEEPKPASEAEKSTSETASAPAASAAAALESQMVVGEEFEKTVRGIMDMLGNSRDEVIQQWRHHDVVFWEVQNNDLSKAKNHIVQDFYVSKTINRKQAPAYRWLQFN